MQPTLAWLGVDDPGFRADVQRALGADAFARFVAIAQEFRDPSTPLDDRGRAELAAQLADLRDDVETAVEAGDPALLDDAIRSALSFVAVLAADGSTARISHQEAPPVQLVKNFSSA